MLLDTKIMAENFLMKTTYRKVLVELGGYDGVSNRGKITENNADNTGEQVYVRSCNDVGNRHEYRFMIFYHENLCKLKPSCTDPSRTVVWEVGYSTNG